MIKRRRPAEVLLPTSVVCRYRYRLSWRELNIRPANVRSRQSANHWPPCKPPTASGLRAVGGLMAVSGRPAGRQRTTQPF